MLNKAKNPGHPSASSDAWDIYASGLLSDVETCRKQYVTAPVTTFVAALLILAALAAPWLIAHGQRVAGFAIAAFFSKLCHQRAGRSLILFGAPAAVCLRCLGIYAGVMAGSLLRVRPRMLFQSLTVALALNCADVAAEVSGLHGNMPLLRLLIGGSLGLAVGAIFSSQSSPQ